MKLAMEPWPGKFGVYYEVDRPTKNALEKKLVESEQQKSGNRPSVDLLRARLSKMA